MPSTLITRREEQEKKTDHLLGLIRTKLLIADLDLDVLQRAGEHGDQLQELVLTGVMRLGRAVIQRKKSRLQLLQECQKAGIRVWNNNPRDANFMAEQDRPMLFEVPQLDLNAIFALRDKKQQPWGGNKTQQETWGKGIRTVQETLQAILDYFREFGHVPDPDRYWVLRCSDPYGSDDSLGVRWHPGSGLSVYCVRVVSSYEGVGALPRE